METDIQENLIRRYLLGDLPEAEQLALEQSFFADDEMFEQLWAAENQLLDSYARNLLAPAQRDLFEKNYLASPVHRERLAFARTLVQAADSPPRPAAFDNRQAVVSRTGFSRWFGGRFMQWSVAVATLFIVVAGLWLLAERGRLRDQMNQLQEAKAEEEQRAAELENRIAEERKRQEELASELERLRRDQGKGEKPTPAPPDSSPQRSVVSLLLSPMILRSVGETAQLKITAATTEVRLQLKIQESSARNFRVSLRTVEGAQVWNASASRKGAAMLNVPVPAAKLSTRDYILTLSANDAANQPQEIGRYFFRVIKQ
jgi:hypothetical protein